MPKTPDNVGVHITGEFLGLSEGKPFTDRNKVEHLPVFVRLLVGDYIERVEYEDLAHATTAVGENAEDRALVTLTVRPIGPWDEANRRAGPVYYRGRSE